MKIFPSKSQWRKWSLPAKASYFGAWLGGIGLLVALAAFAFSLIDIDRSVPVVSILSLYSLVQEDSLETKFTIKNAGRIPVFLVVKGEASIDSKTLRAINRRLETHSQVLSPGQIIRYRGLTIKGDTYRQILDGKSAPEITQTIRIDYGNSEKGIGEHQIFQKVKLDLNKLTKLKGRTQELTGLWLLEESAAK